MFVTELASIDQFRIGCEYLTESGVPKIDSHSLSHRSPVRPRNFESPKFAAGCVAFSETWISVPLANSKSHKKNKTDPPPHRHHSISLRFTVYRLKIPSASPNSPPVTFTIHDAHTCSGGLRSTAQFQLFRKLCTNSLEHTQPQTQVVPTLIHGNALSSPKTRSHPVSPPPSIRIHLKCTARQRRTKHEGRPLRQTPFDASSRILPPKSRI